MRPALDVRPRQDRVALGLVIMFGAVICFTGVDTSAKWLLLGGLPTLQVAFVRYAGHFLGSLIVFMPSDGVVAFRSRRSGQQFLRSVLLLVGAVMNFAALSYLPITVTTTIAFAAPIVVSVLSIPLLGEKVGRRRLSAVVVGFLGVVVVVQPWGTQFHPAMLLSLGSLICGSLYFIMTRKLAGIETNATSQLWGSGIPMLCLLPFGLAHWVWPSDLLGYGVMAAVGAFGFAGHSATTIAHRFADASILTPMIYLQLFFATLAGLLIFGTAPTIWTMVGATIICGSGAYIWVRERQLAQQGNLTR